jgi:phthalate 4,5-dioxygenase reductase component
LGLSPLRIDRMYDVAAGIRAFELVHPEGAELAPFTPGSHLKVVTPGGAVRKYSLCGDPADRGRYVIAVKREEAGQGGSRSMHEQAREGGMLEVSEPDNAFPLVEGAKSYVFIAGGIGITPIRAMIRSLAEAEAPWKLFYLTRSPAHTAFADELAGLGRCVRIHHDGGHPAQAFDLWPVLEKPNTGHVYCCGPRPLMESVRDMTGHWTPKHIHFESFDDGGKPRPDDRAFAVRVARTGLRYDVPVGATILSVLRAHGHDVRSSCEAGTCGTCRTRLVEGEADHRDMVLLPEEMATQIMVCVSRARSPELVLDL